MTDFETVPVGTTKELERVKRERDALAAQLDALRGPALELADAVENRDDLPLHKWALKCARLVSQVQKSGSEPPATILARRDAKSAYDAVYTATVIMNSLEASEYLVDLRQQASQLEKS